MQWKTNKSTFLKRKIFRCIRVITQNILRTVYYRWRYWFYWFFFLGGRKFWSLITDFPVWSSSFFSCLFSDSTSFFISNFKSLFERKSFSRFFSYGLFII